MRRGLTVVFILLVLCITVTAVILLGQGATQPPSGGTPLAETGTQPLERVGDQFLTALKSSDYDRAFSLCAANLRQEVGSASGLAAYFAQHNFTPPVRWSITNRSVENKQGELTSDAVLTSGAQVTITLVLFDEGGWKVGKIGVTQK